MNQSNKHELVRQVVESGAVSGIFYILVTNLPPGTNFCDLKTLARKVASVDKCFINPKTYEGWVRVRNLRDFQNISCHLNGLDYKGYKLSASDENGTGPVYIWDQKKSRSATNASSSGNRGTGGPASSPYANTSPGLAYAQYSPVNGNSPTMEFSNTYHGYDSGYSSGASSLGYHYPAERSAHTVTAMAPDLASSKTGNVGVSVGAGETWYAAYDPPSGFGYDQDYSHDYGSYNYGYGQGSYPTEEVPQTVKVVVKNLSRHATPKELEAYLLKAAGGRHKLQEDVRFPRHSSLSGTGSSSSRQHAFLLFKMHSDALAAVNRLDKVKILGLVVEARLATETVLPLRGPPSFPAPMGTHSDATVAAGMPSDKNDATTGATFSGGNANNDPATSGFRGDSKPRKEKSHNLVVDGKSTYGHVKKAVEEHRKHKHKK
ncbi:hypothetical protein SEUCBS139899_000218 [Sporothrix eucalyptigena]|uniref:RRM domain-containing protein n=1 Tax=Sporothrix eucalyptigena TaxID=1812306 RepID=A0ABP0BM23_9PEZI